MIWTTIDVRNVQTAQCSESSWLIIAAVHRREGSSHFHCNRYHKGARMRCHPYPAWITIPRVEARIAVVLLEQRLQLLTDAYLSSRGFHQLSMTNLK